MNMKLIPEENVPIRERGKWLNSFKQIPEGQAWVITEGDVETKISSIKTVAYRLIKAGELPNYRVAQRTIDHKETLFIMHHKEATP